MDEKELSRREFLHLAATAGGAVLAGSSMLSLNSEAAVAPGKPIAPISLMYYGNRPEIVEFFKKAAIDLRKVGITPKLNPAASQTVITKTRQRDFGDVTSILRAAVPYRIDPNYFLEELLHSKGGVVGGANFRQV
jgi:hypothetical protein